MDKLAKAIKLANQLTDEQKKDFAEFFKKEEEQTEVIEEVVVKKEEEPIVKEEKVDANSIKELFKSMRAEIKTLSETVEKSVPFGVKAQPKKPKDTSEFDDVFANLDGQKG